jgi:hypothetical protein
MGLLDVPPSFPPKPVTVMATAYCSGAINAEGHRPRLGHVAVLPGALTLGSLIEVIHPRRVFGRRLFRVADHIGSGSQLDFYRPGFSEPLCGNFRLRVTYRPRKRIR